MPRENEYYNFNKRQPFQGQYKLSCQTEILAKSTEQTWSDLVVLETTRAMSCGLSTEPTDLSCYMAAKMNAAWGAWVA